MLQGAWCGVQVAGCKLLVAGFMGGGKRLILINRFIYNI